MKHRFGPSYMLTEARESGVDDVSTWSTYVRAPRANRSDPSRESPLQLRQSLGDSSWTSVTALN